MYTVKEEIAKNLLYYRKKCKMTQKELAEKIGVKNNTISQWENGTNSIDVELLFNICDILGVSVNDMFGTFSNVEQCECSSFASEMIRKFNLLNEEGQVYIQKQFDFALSQVEYKKRNNDDVGEKEISKQA